MTDRVKALTVILERDNREDDTQALVDAISMFHGVAKVEMVKVTPDDYINRERIRREFRERLWKALEDKQ
jgi:hypothetical protein